jgi:hypothetical protein
MSPAIGKHPNSILSMGWLCQSEYEWAQHARIAITSAGMSLTQGSIKMPAMRTLLKKEEIEQVSRFVAGGMTKK